MPGTVLGLGDGGPRPIPAQRLPQGGGTDEHICSSSATRYVPACGSAHCGNSEDRYLLRVWGTEGSPEMVRSEPELKERYKLYLVSKTHGMIGELVKEKSRARDLTEVGDESGRH